MEEKFKNDRGFRGLFVQDHPGAFDPAGRGWDGHLRQHFVRPAGRPDPGRQTHTQSGASGLVEAELPAVSL